VQHTPAKLRPRRELFVDVKGIPVTRDLDESPHVVFRERLSQCDVLAGLEIFDAGDHGHGFDGFFVVTFDASRRSLIAMTGRLLMMLPCLT
jgi:hypothetical protein